jgi:small subunit ribosomal protein S6
MNRYELTFIIAPDVDDAELNGTIENVKGWVSSGGGTVNKTHTWGRQRLAYTIHRLLKSYNEGYYVTLNFEMNATATVSLERNLRLSEKVLRHLLLRDE